MMRLGQIVRDWIKLRVEEIFDITKVKMSTYTQSLRKVR